MGEGDDQIRPRPAQARHGGAGAVEDGAHGEFAGEVMTFPNRGLGRQKAKDAHHQVMRGAVLVPQLAAQEDLARREGSPLRGGAKTIKIGADRGKARLPQGVAQQVQPLAEFVVAQGHRIIAQMVHGRDHRVDVLAVVFLALRASVGHLSHMVGQRAAVQEIAIVQQEAARHLGARLGDQAGNLGQPPVWRGAVGQIIPRQDVAVQVGGGQNAQGNAGVWRGGARCGDIGGNAQVIAHGGLRDGSRLFDLSCRFLASAAARPKGQSRARVLPVLECIVRGFRKPRKIPALVVFCVNQSPQMGAVRYSARKVAPSCAGANCVLPRAHAR